MRSKTYPLYQPFQSRNLKSYVEDCIDSGWISSIGKYVEKFENSFIEYTKLKYAISVNNGTSALELALKSIELKKGDEVIVPAYTYVATANAVVNAGGEVVLADCEEKHFSLDINKVQGLITKKTKAIILVHIYGLPVKDYESYRDLCNKNKIYLIEDAAEALGSFYRGSHIGYIGDVTTFSFYGNKTVTTGEGGMVATNIPELASKARKIRNQGMTNVQYYHDVVGSNYRMTNIQAAIGYSQLEQIHEIIQNKDRVFEQYKKNLICSDISLFASNTDDKFYKSSYWMICLSFKSKKIKSTVEKSLKEKNIDTRPGFHPLHLMPMYKNNTSTFQCSESLYERVLLMPSYPDLKNKDIDLICSIVLDTIN